MSLGPWGWLLAAGAVEVAWSQSIKPTHGFTRPGATVVCFVLGVGAVYLLTHALTAIPVGTAYVVFTGIGALGAVVLGMTVSGDPVSLPRLGALALIVTGVALCHLTETA